MNSKLEAQGKLVPEMIVLLQERYRLLKLVKVAGPIGRRPLGEMANLTEREIRTMLDHLRAQGLINIAKNGASITFEGLQVLEALEPDMEDWLGRITIAKRLTNLLQIRSVLIVPGDSDSDESTKSLLAQEAANQFTNEIGRGTTVAVTGGSSIALIPNHIEKFTDPSELLFIAARGGVGEDIGLQANVIAASFAQASGGSYRSFYYPDSLGKEAHEAFLKDPSIVKMIGLYDTVDCVLHGIGNAQTMAKLRESSEEERLFLKNKGAQGEAFGYYFDEQGNAVHRIRTVGIQIEQLARIPLIISVAGGKNKAKAILAYMATAPEQSILVTDEGAANEMIKRLTK
ncbi:sugar-binding transcriptional regulator [Sporosarcina sp. CAU 1771]